VQHAGLAFKKVLALERRRSTSATPSPTARLLAFFEPSNPSSSPNPSWNRRRVATKSAARRPSKPQEVSVWGGQHGRSALLLVRALQSRLIDDRNPRCGAAGVPAAVLALTLANGGLPSQHHNGGHPRPQGAFSDRRPRPPRRAHVHRPFRRGRLVLKSWLPPGPRSTRHSDLCPRAESCWAAPGSDDGTPPGAPCGRGGQRLVAQGHRHGRLPHRHVNRAIRAAAQKLARSIEVWGAREQRAGPRPLPPVRPAGRREGAACTA
jgi:hypothetical protein